jgi:polysaccharide pyruvyl transferase WcaK-like protein
MLEANILHFRQLFPNMQFAALSRDPSWTAQNYGVDSLPMPKWSPGIDCSEQWLGSDIVNDLHRSNGLIISGGGNLCSTWPDKIHERVALMDAAVKADIPVVVLGQTLGPVLTADERRLLGKSFTHIKWLGVRDDASAAMALELGTPSDRIHLQLDDAFFLDSREPGDDRAQPFCDPGRRWIVVTLDASFGAPERASCVEVLASQLDSLAQHLQASLVFVPHVGGRDAGDALSDEVAGRALAKHLGSKFTSVGLWSPREARWLIDRAVMVVSTRYHALVFATASGVPAIGIYSDDYSRIKLRAALGNAGLEAWCISAAMGERGHLFPLAAELWCQRNQVSERLADLRATAWPQEAQRWAAICDALELKPNGTLVASQAPALRCHSAANAESQCTLTEEDWLTYEQQGYLRLGKILSDDALTALGERLNAIMLGQIHYPTLEMQLDTGGAYEDLSDPVRGFLRSTLAYRKIQGLEADPMILELITRGIFREICARHYGRHASVSIFRVMMMNKPAGQGTYLPWHQDAGDVWKLDRDPLVTTWIALDPATRANGCVQVIPGSHRLGLLSKRGSNVSEANIERYCPANKIEHLELDAGEGLLLHNWLLHRSDINHTNSPRRALSACYMDGRTLNALTGERFPIVFGESEEPDVALPFFRSLLDNVRRYEVMFRDAERYALSLLEDNRTREGMRAEAERYAKSLEKALHIVGDNELKTRGTVPKQTKPEGS